MTVEYVRTYIQEILTFYPEANLRDYDDIDDALLALPCLENRLIQKGCWCDGCPHYFELSKWSSYCARISFVGMK